ncbi:low temperature requirement protein A [Candidatus Solirubrobacter pratensis]|uniref:low temperature requirement protein A n=1 Tax=Candidatus Solirubrobacter pratensis TaxID=1298857 RepID=UPI00040F39A2|nr:low temperature requirement protein A [Candidatus Solirubrobacter pratensis]
MTAVAEPEHHVESEQRVTPLELFFDLVFVFAITQVTTMLAADPTWAGLARGMLVFSALWWAWAAFSWLTNSVDAEEGPTRAAMIAAMAAALVASLAVPGAFGDEALVFALAYTALRLLHIVVYVLAAPSADVRGAIARMAPGFVIFCGLLLLASAFDGWVQGAIWCLALLVHILGLVVVGVRGWQVSPAHFAERHGLIVIIALGESIVSIGVGAAGLEVDGGVIAAAALGILATSALWWAYFDVVAPVAQRRLEQARGDARTRMARDSYTFLHLPMLAGIVLLALGIKKTVSHYDEELKLVPAVALCGGVALYLLALVAFRLRNVHTWNTQRTVAGVVCLALIPAATAVPALAALALVTALLCALIAYEAIHFAEARARVRHAGR